MSRKMSRKINFCAIVRSPLVRLLQYARPSKQGHGLFNCHQRETPFKKVEYLVRLMYKGARNGTRKGTGDSESACLRSYVVSALSLFCSFAKWNLLQAVTPGFRKGTRKGRKADSVRTGISRNTRPVMWFFTLPVSGLVQSEKVAN